MRRGQKELDEAGQPRVRETAAKLTATGFDEGSNAKPGYLVVDRAFVD